MAAAACILRASIAIGVDASRAVQQGNEEGVDVQLLWRERQGQRAHRIGRDVAAIE